ncbi:MAG: tRNA-dihydrouridine synthase [Methanobacteriaceae archaeon]|nr:tRNA-dihydrouridine synthase [Methanobacteriaceae archaeon]MDP2837072.1 tRNA-dihydrouridine synthase [Methanobacteriaceae archaeon]MDP3034045.1 tRNA-dihydrouridine synthase [Methanobacteriaceae archaeon]MDP3484490.1 tRNA-dihydrouridine synthase [Methanobacteriaceae archaeon]MDP3624462.1 tRNA-dihydrouridine synthase [Methanobacteriaceae archaeon]
MAGITDAKFCLKLIPFGFDMVTLGGYNIDSPTITAGEKILQRGRPEFSINEEDYFEVIYNQAKEIKENWNGLVSVNLRSTTPDPIIQISRIKEVDVVEINAHCRQSEITEIGCGQAMLQDLEHLGEFSAEVVKNSSAKVSVKFRANVLNLNDLEIAKAVESSGCDFIHIDAMKPGFNYADLDIIHEISQNIETFLVGNNSIVDINSAKKMLDAGANGISIARAAMGGRINFDLSKI